MRMPAFVFVCAALNAIFAVPSMADTLTLRFGQISQFANEHSPSGKLITSRYSVVEAQRSLALQWSNPEFTYEQQEVDGVREYEITVAKPFELPWAYMNRRNGWNMQREAAKLHRDNQTDMLLMRLKSGYVSLALYEKQLRQIGKLRDVIGDASRVASERRTEGHLSGVDEHLVQMLLVSLHASQQNTLETQRETNTEWRAAMGVNPDDNLILASTPSYRAYTTESASEYVAALESRPAVRSRALLSESFGKLASSERGRFIPSVNLYGGYKQIESSDGYIAGISLALPLFNRNGAAARQYDVQRQITEYETTIYRKEAVGRIEALVASIAEMQQVLSGVSTHFDSDTTGIANLFFSYEEGYITLNEMLNAVQIEIAGMEDYYELLRKYYQFLFELEAITGGTLVQLEN